MNGFLPLIKETVGAVFPDMKVAFDFDHILCDKLVLYNVHDETVTSVQSYLSNRTQQVQFKYTTSSPAIIKYGVPQRSILGPILFLLYVNDLPLYVDKTKTDMYADDVIFHTTGTDPTRIANHIQTDLENINQWCLQNGMYINTSKTKTMLLSTAPKLYHHSNLQLSINEEIIGNIDIHKLLGVHVDKKVTWHTHVNYICKLAASRLTLMQRLFHYMPGSSFNVPIYHLCWTNVVLYGDLAQEITLKP